MGEYADQLLDGTCDPETGEYNFPDGARGPGFPMTWREAAAYVGDRPHHPVTAFTGNWALVASAILAGHLHARAIAKHLGMGRNQVDRHLRSMESNHFIRRYGPNVAFTERGRRRAVLS